MVSVTEGIIKAAIVLIPTYTMAFLTDKMVYVIPMLAAASFFANSFTLENRVDDIDMEDEAYDS